MSIKTFILHDETLNSRGFRMLTSGANLTEFRKNPVMLFMHNDCNMPIGRWENIRIEGTKILADPVFDEKDKTALEVMGKVNRGFIRMASAGSWPPEEISDDPYLKLPGQSLPTVTKWTMREASIVTIGSNHNAIAFYDRTTGKKVDLNDIQTSILREKRTGTINLIELTELKAMNWKQIDRANKLGILKTKYYDLYESKFIEEFGHKPNKR